MEPSWCPGRIANFSPRVPSHWKKAFIAAIKKTLLKLTTWFRDNYGASVERVQTADKGPLWTQWVIAWKLCGFSLLLQHPLRRYGSLLLADCAKSVFPPPDSESLRLPTECILLCCRGPQSCVGCCCRCPACPSQWRISSPGRVPPLNLNALKGKLQRDPYSHTHTFFPLFLIDMPHCKQT